MLLFIALFLVMSSNLFYHGHFIEGKPNILLNVVYVSRHRGKAKNDSCGTKSLPCKTIQVGIDNLAWGGQLFVDGEHTQVDPYTCESSAGKLVVKKSFLIQSYTTTAHISCADGFHILANDWNTDMNVTITGVQFNNNSLFLKDTSLVIRNCIFAASSPAIAVTISNSFSLYSLDMQNAVFTRNIGCIQVDVEQGRSCNRIIMTLRDTVFLNNTTPIQSGMEGNGLIFVRNKNCCCQVMSLFSMWKNVTVVNNQGSKATSYDININKNYGKHKVKSNNSADSLFVVDACRVNLTFSNVRSVNNENMRFYLALQSRDVFIHIESSSYHGHHIDQPGGVIYVKGNDKTTPTRTFVNVTISDSVFVNNSGTIGGVLQIDGEKDKSVRLSMNNVSLFNSYGSVYGGTVSVGNAHKPQVAHPSVEEIVAKFNGLEVLECHDRFLHTNKSYRKLYPVLYLEAREIANIVIKNSHFKRNNNRAILIKHTSSGYGLSSGRTINVQIDNTSFVQNYSPSKATVEAFVSSPKQFKKSILNISMSVFLRNRGVAISALRIVEVLVRNCTFKATSKYCLNMEYSQYPKTKSPSDLFNSTLQIENSSFIENDMAFKFEIMNPEFVSIFVKNTIFHSNRFTNKRPMEIRVGAKGGIQTLISGTMVVDNVSFTSNYVQHRHGSVLGIIITPNSGSFTVLVRNTIFKNNSHRHGKRTSAFINLFYFNIPHVAFKNGSCTNKYRDPRDTCPIYHYRNKITFENVTFINNTAITSTLFINSGNVSFHKCLFKNNFSFQPGIGAHVFVEKGSTSGNFYDSKFIQTKKDPGEHLKLFSLSPLLFFGAHGPMELRNTSFKFDLFIVRTVPMLILERGHFVHFDNETIFSCPIGSFLKMYNATFELSSDLSTEEDCIKVTVIHLRLRCRTCPVNKYTLESGSLRGMQGRSFVNCLDCPFGARCTTNVQSRPNFWGYKTSENPPQLKFEKCPEGYCSQPEPRNLSVYNKCAGNRNGTMCGACEEGFTESMFNHKCRPIKDCGDSWFWVMAALYSVIMTIVVLCQPSLILFLVKKALWFKKKKVPNSTVESMNKTHGHDGHAYFKIIFYFYQVAELLMLESSSEILPQVPWLSSITSFYNFQVDVADSSFGCPFQGLTAVTKELFRCLQVFATMLAIVVFFSLHWLISFIWKKPRPRFAHYLAAIIEILLLGYERLGHTSLKLLNCAPLDMVGKVEWRLVLDGNITCWVHWWQYAMIAYNIVFVIPFLLVLFVGTSKLKNREITAWHFVAACFVPLPFLTYWMIRNCLKCGIDVSEDPNPWEEEKRNSLLEVLQGPFRPPDIQSKGALYWESILIGRRLVMLCLFSFVALLLPRLLCMTLVCIVILVHNVIIMPYKEWKANIFALFLLTMHVVMATINLSESVLITAGVSLQGPLKTQLGGCKIFEIFLLSVLPCAFVLLVVSAVLSQTVRLLLIVYRCCFEDRFSDADDNSRRASYNPLLNPSEETQTNLN